MMSSCFTLLNLALLLHADSLDLEQVGSRVDLESRIALTSKLYFAEGHKRQFESRGLAKKTLWTTSARKKGLVGATCLALIGSALLLYNTRK